MKKMLLLMAMVSLCGVLIFTGTLSVFASEVSNDVPEISPCLVNCGAVTINFSIHDPDEGVFRVTYSGINNVFTRAHLTVQVQKRFLGLFWINVGNEWTGSSTSLIGLFTDTIAVDGKGTYRAVFTLDVYGTSGVIDTIEETREYKYN